MTDPAFAAAPPLIDRPLKPALWRGWRRRCPRCGQGALFDGYLSVHDDCGTCGQALHHHRADDGPAWATIMIAGHIMAPLMLTIFTAFRPEPWMMAVGFSAMLVLLSLYLLPRLKGMFIAFQWARRMHGFDGAAD